MHGCRITKTVFALLAATLLGAGAAEADERSGAVFLGPEPLSSPLAAVRVENSDPALAAPPGQTVGAGYDDDQDGRVVYRRTWSQRASTFALNGTFRQSNLIGSSVRIPFQGNRVTVYYLPVRGGGVLDIYLDTFRRRIGSIDQSRAFRPQAYALELAGISDTAPHTLILRHRSGRKVTFDAIAVRDTATELPVEGAASYAGYYYWPAASHQDLTYRGLWNVWPGYNTRSQRLGDSVTFTFTGDTFILYFWMDSTMRSLGTIKVFLDDRLLETVNQRVPPRDPQTGCYMNGWWWYFWEGLANRQHTVRLRQSAGQMINLEGVGAFNLDTP